MYIKRLQQTLFDTTSIYNFFLNQVFYPVEKYLFQSLLLHKHKNVIVTLFLFRILKIGSISYRNEFVIFLLRFFVAVNSNHYCIRVSHILCPIFRIWLHTSLCSIQHLESLKFLKVKKK